METLKKDITKLLTIADYAKKIGVSRQTIYTRIADGLLKTVKISNILFVETN